MLSTCYNVTRTRNATHAPELKTTHENPMCVPNRELCG